MKYKHDYVVNNNVRTGPFPPMPLAHAEVDVAGYIKSRGLSYSLAMANGWYGSLNAGDSQPRVVIPAINRQGVPYWQARILTDSPAYPRYQSPSMARFDSIIVVNPYPLIFHDSFVIVEGPFDALAMAERGCVAVALMGNNPPTIVWDHIWQRFDKQYAFLISDSDSINATVKWQAFLALRGIKSGVSLTYSGKDAASISLQERMNLLHAFSA